MKDKKPLNLTADNSVNSASKSDDIVRYESIEELLTAYQFLAEEFGRVMALAGYSENEKVATQDAMTWIDPAKRPSTDHE